MLQHRRHQDVALDLAPGLELVARPQHLPARELVEERCLVASAGIQHRAKNRCVPAPDVRLVVLDQPPPGLEP
eukprot:8894801-Alexandrium_andersonii.AAC.1